MHKKPKQFIPQILLSVALLLFFSCTFDGHEHHDADAHQHDGEIILRRINWHELNSSVPKLSHAIKEANAKNVKGTSLLARDGSAEKTYTINTDEVIAISKDGKTTYTFSITREDETHLTENLVVTLDLSGKMTGRIIVYDLTEQDKTKIEQKQPVDLEGKISYKEVGELTNLPVQLSVSNGSMTLTDCVFSIVVGGGVCPSRQHDLHQMQSGMCSYVNNGSYTPNPETLVQIIVDEDCLNGSTAGGGSGNPSDGNQNPGNPTNPVNNEPIGGNGGNGGNSSNNGNTPEEPDPNSPNPTDPSHDLGGEPVITTPFIPVRIPGTNKTPCEILKQQTVDNAEISSKIDSLKQRVLPSTPNFDTSETMVNIKRLDDEYHISVSNSSTTGNGVINVTGTLNQFDVARIHNHPINSIPVFSHVDIVEHFDSYNFVLGSRKNEFTDYLVNFNNTTYALRMENTEALTALFAGLDLNTEQGKEDAEKKVFKIFRNYGLKEENNPPYTQAMAEELFMNVVNDPKMGGGNGINLYRKDADGWGKLVKNGNTIQKVPCN